MKNKPGKHSGWSRQDGRPLYYNKKLKVWMREKEDHWELSFYRAAWWGDDPATNRAWFGEFETFEEAEAMAVLIKASKNE